MPARATKVGDVINTIAYALIHLLIFLLFPEILLLSSRGNENGATTLISKVGASSSPSLQGRFPSGLAVLAFGVVLSVVFLII